MFTGLVADVGTVARADRRSDALVLAIRPAAFALADLAIGESICHDGACLTVTAIDGRGVPPAGSGAEARRGSFERDSYTVLAGAETLARTTLGQVRVGTKLNLERALRLGDRLGGHWVTGHIDGAGELAIRRDLGANLVLGIRTPAALLRHIVEKGSIAIAGVSLTVNAVDRESFSVAIIPHTREHTTLGALAIGDRVNLETDILAKHVEKLVAGGQP